MIAANMMVAGALIGILMAIRSRNFAAGCWSCTSLFLALALLNYINIGILCATK